jgi:hypothetical protein
MLKVISGYTAQLAQVRSQIVEVEKQNLRQVTKGMSLRDRVSLLSQKAA